LGGKGYLGIFGNEVGGGGVALVLGDKKRSGPGLNPPAKKTLGGVEVLATLHKGLALNSPPLELRLPLTRKVNG